MDKRLKKVGLDERAEQPEKAVVRRSQGIGGWQFVKLGTKPHLEACSSARVSAREFFFSPCETV